MTFFLYWIGFVLKLCLYIDKGMQPKFEPETPCITYTTPMIYPLHQFAFPVLF